LETRNSKCRNWVTFCYKWVTICNKWVTFCYEWVTICYEWVTFCYEWVTFCNEWVTICYEWVTFCYEWVTFCYEWVTIFQDSDFKESIPNCFEKNLKPYSEKPYAHNHIKQTTLNNLLFYKLSIRGNSFVVNQLQEIIT